MCCKNFWLRIVPFVLALTFGLLTVNFLHKEESVVKTPETFSSETKPLQIISKPRAGYTDAARQNQLQGTVTLRVTFSASGEIGSVSAIEELPDGLTEQAILAARGIRFEPAQKNGVPQTVTKQVQYSFMLY